MRGTQTPQTCDLTSLVDAARDVRHRRRIPAIPWLHILPEGLAARLQDNRVREDFTRTSHHPQREAEYLGLRASSGEPNKSGRGNSPSIQSTVVSYLGTFGQKSGGSAHQ